MRIGKTADSGCLFTLAAAECIAGGKAGAGEAAQGAGGRADWRELTQDRDGIRGKTAKCRKDGKILQKCICTVDKCAFCILTDGILQAAAPRQQDGGYGMFRFSGGKP